MQTNDNKHKPNITNKQIKHVNKITANTKQTTKQQQKPYKTKIHKNNTQITTTHKQ